MLAKLKDSELYEIYEVKPYSTAMECIRVALGQLLFYKALLEKRAKNPDFKGNLEIQFLAETSPRLYRRFMESGNPFDSNNAKMLEIMSSKIDKAG